LTSFQTGLTDLGEVALSPDGQTLVASNGQLILHAWDLEQKRDRFATTGTHTAPINNILASPDGRTLTTGSVDRTLRLWDLGTARSSRELRISGPVHAMAWSADGRWLAAATFIHHQIFAWDLSKGRGPIVLAYGGGLNTIAPLAARFVDDRTLLIVDKAAKVHRLDLSERRRRSTTPLQISPPDRGLPQTGDDRLTRAVFLAEGRKVATQGIFSGLHVNETETGKELLHSVDGDLVIASPDGRLLALAKSTGEPRLGRASRLVGRKVGFEPMSTSGVISLVNAESGQELRQMMMEGSQPWALAFSPDGKTLAATSGWETGRIHFFDVASGRPIRTIDAPPLRSPALAYTPDGTRLVSGMADGSVLIWDVRPDR
jgi:WD40 repeat protein